MLEITLSNNLSCSVYPTFTQMNGKYVLNKLPKFESIISEELCNKQYHRLFFNIYKIPPQTKLQNFQYKILNMTLMTNVLLCR